VYDTDCNVRHPQTFRYPLAFSRLRAVRRFAMMISSLLDTDLYKFTMMQVVLHHFPAAQVEYRYKCRTPGVNLSPYLDEIRAEIGDAKMAMDGDGFVVERGGDGLKGLLMELVEQLLKVHAPKDVPGITALKTRIENIFK